MDENNYYRLLTNRDGSIRFDVKIKGVRQQLLTLPAGDPAKAGTQRKVSLIARGSHFTFYVNDRPVGEIQDTQLARGFVGVALTAPRAVPANVAFYDFLLRAP